MFEFSTSQNNFFPMDLTVVVMELIAACICVYLHLSVERPLRQKAGIATDYGATTTTVSEKQTVSGDEVVLSSALP